MMDKGSHNKNYKDGVFRLLFNEPKAASELYYALTCERCDEKDIELITLGDVLASPFKNDLAFIVGEKAMIISEHQSTLNANMPLRILLYLGRLMENFLSLKDLKTSLYDARPLKLPSPQFVVLYNGDAEWHVDNLSLSSLFNSDIEKALGYIELTVPIININKGKSPAIEARSKILSEYTALIATVKDFVKQGDIIDNAVKKAIKWCKGTGILEDFLLRHGGVIVSILSDEFDLEASRKNDREYWMEEGLKEGQKKEQINMVRKLKKTVLTLEQIAQISGLSVNDVEKI